MKFSYCMYCMTMWIWFFFFWKKVVDFNWWIYRMCNLACILKEKLILKFRIICVIKILKNKLIKNILTCLHNWGNLKFQLWIIRELYREHFFRWQLYGVNVNETISYQNTHKSIYLWRRCLLHATFLDLIKSRVSLIFVFHWVWVHLKKWRKFIMIWRTILVGESITSHLNKISAHESG